MSLDDGAGHQHLIVNKFMRLAHIVRITEAKSHHEISGKDIYNEIPSTLFLKQINSVRCA